MCIKQILRACHSQTLESRPIATIEQWAVTNNTISLDFGDYFDKFHMQTGEGKQIAQLISGYAELIRKRQRRDSDNHNRYTDTMYSNGSSSGDARTPVYEELDEAKRLDTRNMLVKVANVIF